MEPTPTNPSHLPWWILPGLAALVLAIFAVALVASYFGTDDTLRTQMFTGAYGLATLAVGYFFGSSAGSAKKDDAMVASSKAPTTTTTATTLSEPATTVTTTTAADAGVPVAGAP